MFLLPRAPFVWKEAVQLSFASISCIFCLGEVAGQGRAHQILGVLLHDQRLLVSVHLLHCCPGRSWEHSRGNIYSHWQGKIDLHDYCWLLLGCPKISIMKLFIHSPSKRKYFTSAVWSRSSSAGMCSWPVSEFLEEESPQGVSQSCCQTVRSICFFLRWQLLMLKIRRCVNSLNYSITCHSFISSLQKNRNTCV